MNIHKSPSKTQRAAKRDTVVEELPRFTPFIRPELPRLSSRHNTNNTIPSVRPKLGQCFNAVDNKVLGLYLSLLAT